MSDQVGDPLRERSEAAYREWYAKQKELAELQTRFVSGKWGWPRTPTPPLRAGDADAAIRETQQARDAERAAWQAYVHAFLALAQSGLDAEEPLPATPSALDRDDT
jgi:hypothetical protein